MIHSRKSSLIPVQILLVDDNPHGNVARKTFLEGHGFVVETALSGEHAWELFQAGKFAIVVTDLRMGAMSGMDLIALIRASGQQAWTVLLSGFCGGMGLTEETSGADAVLCKGSAELEHLKRAVDQLLARSGRRKPAASETKKKKSTTAHVARSG